MKETLKKLGVTVFPCGNPCCEVQIGSRKHKAHKTPAFISQEVTGSSWYTLIIVCK